jgi:hypothetical protein
MHYFAVEKDPEPPSEQEEHFDLSAERWKMARFQSKPPRSISFPRLTAHAPSLGTVQEEIWNGGWTEAMRTALCRAKPLQFHEFYSSAHAF